MQELSNWSGSVRFTPKQIIRPKTEIELVKIVKHAIKKKRTVRPLGSCHSSSPIIQTDDILISMQNFQGLNSFNLQNCEANIGAGMTLEDANKALLSKGLEPHNLGDINKQMVVGAISTGTHGSGKCLKNLSSMLVGGRIITGKGEIREFSAVKNPEFLSAIQVSLGTYGVFSSLTLKLMPAQKLHLREWFIETDDCLSNLPELVENNRNFDFYWYPRCDIVKLRIMNPEQQPAPEVAKARCILDKTDWSSQITPRERTLKFDEMEYDLPAKHGPTCFKEIREIVKRKHRQFVGWRILYRTIAADNAFLSTAYDRQTVSISLHQNNTLPFWEYFKDIEPIFRSYDGRPHWAKKHTLTSKEIKLLYPKFDRFNSIRQDNDPNGVFLNPYLKTILED